MTFGERVIEFNKNIRYTGTLPRGVEIMNPFMESEEALDISSRFYQKFYNDNKPRRIILGINPGRHGAGITGVPFTDTKRMQLFCNLQFKGINSHELSSVFIYDMISAYGSVESFYNKFYINSVCPLGFVKSDKTGRRVNYNYYDDPILLDMVTPFIRESIETQISFGIDTDTAYCLGTGKNFRHLSELNSRWKYFTRIIPLEHPRYIMQYKLKEKEKYISKYIHLLV